MDSNKNNEKEFICDICGKDGFFATRDAREVDPIRDEKGELWTVWEAASDWRFGCKHHHPGLSKVLYKDPNKNMCLTKDEIMQMLEYEDVKRDWNTDSIQFDQIKRYRKYQV